MQGLVTLDFGNSNPHAGLFQKDAGVWNLIKVVPLSELAIYLTQLGMSAHNSSVVLCEVKSREDEITKLQEQGFLVTRVKDYWRGNKFAGMPVHYAKTLGEDRLIEAYYCYKKEKAPTLVIDAGTFVTMDVVNAEGFQGGYIIPGAKAYYSTYQIGEQLKSVPINFVKPVPTVEDLKTAPPKFEFTKNLPSETTVAITDSYIAFVALAKSLVSEHKIEKIILTGGLSHHWEGFFLGTVVETHPHLIHWALHNWMTTQIEPL